MSANRILTDPPSETSGHGNSLANGHVAAPRPVPPHCRLPSPEKESGPRSGGQDESAGSDGIDGIFREREAELDGLDGSDGISEGVAGEIASFLAEYIVAPPLSLLAIAGWVLAAWLMDVWDRFPHLAISSPEKRCGKTRLLQLLELITPNAYSTTNISPAALYRLIAQQQPTLLLDEAQSISRRGSEASEVIREILNAGIDKNAKVLRCGGEKNDEIVEFKVYSPKVVALIGALDGVLADRCLPINLKRKTKASSVLPYRSRLVAPRAAELQEKIKQWTQEHADKIASVYDRLEPFGIDNDRLAELLLPLQVVLQVAAPAQVEMLEKYALEVDAKDKEAERRSDGVRLLAACRAIFAEKAKDHPKDGRFIGTGNLIIELVSRAEEPWATFGHGKPITAEALANLLRPYGIESHRNRSQTERGYSAHDFQDAWERYLEPKPADG
jgi:hypothetical protein